MKGFKIKWYNWNKTEKRIMLNDKVGNFTAMTFARYSDKFIPMDTGMLSQTFEVEPFKITYTVPYARRIYNGSGFNFKTDKHPSAQAYWDRATIRTHGNQIAKEISQFIRRM